MLASWELNKAYNFTLVLFLMLWFTFFVGQEESLICDAPWSCDRCIFQSARRILNWKMDFCILDLFHVVIHIFFFEGLCAWLVAEKPAFGDLSRVCWNASKFSHDCLVNFCFCRQNLIFFFIFFYRISKKKLLFNEDTSRRYLDKAGRKNCNGYRVLYFIPD